MSCVPPLYYKERFFEYLNNLFIKDDVDNQEKGLLNKDNINKGCSNNNEKPGDINSSEIYQNQDDIKRNNTDESLKNLK